MRTSYDVKMCSLSFYIFSHLYMTMKMKLNYISVILCKIEYSLNLSQIPYVYIVGITIAFKPLKQYQASRCLASGTVMTLFQ